MIYCYRCANGDQPSKNDINDLIKKLSDNPELMRQIQEELALESMSNEIATLKSLYMDYNKVYHTVTFEELQDMQPININNHSGNLIVQQELTLIPQSKNPEITKTLCSYYKKARPFAVYNDNIIDNYYKTIRQAQQAAKQDHRYLVYKYNQTENVYELIGSCTIYPLTNQLDISCSYNVLPKFQRQGLGSQMLQLIERYIIQLNQTRSIPWKNFVLHIDINNKASCGLAEKYGFTRLTPNAAYSRNKALYEYSKLLPNIPTDQSN